MAHDKRKADSEQEGQSRRSSQASRGNQQYEGFEGMNYEQVRRPYGTPERNRNSNPHGNHGEKHEER